MQEEMGQALRTIRKDKKLRIADLAEKGLSSATISFIEQRKQVKPQKLNRYCEKLGVQPNEFPTLVHKQVQSNNQLKTDLFLIESKIQLGIYDSSLMSELRDVEEHCGDLLDVLNFLKGEYYFKRKN